MPKTKPFMCVALLMLFVAQASRASAQGAAPRAVDGAPRLASPSNPRRLYLEVYVNSADKRHLGDVVDRVIKLRQQRGVPLPFLYHIGDYRNVPAATKAQLRAEGVRIFPLSAPPGDLPIALSPAWVFVTPEGRRIVEGTLTIERFIDANGEYRDGSKIPPEKAQDRAVPEQKMEGF